MRLFALLFMNVIPLVYSADLPPVVSQAEAEDMCRNWACMKGNIPFRLSKNGRDPQCLSFNGTWCTAFPGGTAECEAYINYSSCVSKILQGQTQRIMPLTCGATHMAIFGIDGYGSPVHWCYKNRERLQKCYGWMCRSDFLTPVRLDFTDPYHNVECYSTNGQTCRSYNSLAKCQKAADYDTCIATQALNVIDPVTCGAEYASLPGSGGLTGYEDPNHWCRASVKPLNPCKEWSCKQGALQRTTPNGSKVCIAFSEAPEVFDSQSQCVSFLNACQLPSYPPHDTPCRYTQPDPVADTVSLFKILEDVDIYVTGAGDTRNPRSSRTDRKALLPVRFSGPGPVVIKEAKLYWYHSSQSAEPTLPHVFFNGVTVNAERMTPSSTVCWEDYTQAYRGDVTSLITPTPPGVVTTYTVTGLNETHGVSLIIVFDDKNPENDKGMIYWFDGNDVMATEDNAVIHVSASDVYKYNQGTVTMQLHVADGQVEDDGAIVVNSQVIVQEGPIFSGRLVDGEDSSVDVFYDIVNFDISGVLNPGYNAFELSSNVVADCLALSVSLLISDQ